MMRLALLVTALAGCALERPRPPLVLSPTEEVRDATERAVARWVASGGVDVRVAPGGVRVGASASAELALARPQTPRWLLDELRGAAADGACGATGVVRRKSGDFHSLDQVVVIRHSASDCPSDEHVILHEIGHALCEWEVDGSSEDWCHIPDRGALMNLSGSRNAIDAASLTVVCSRAQCTAFNPEI